MTTPEAFKANREQLTAIATAFGRHGIKDRADRLRLVGDHVGRTVHSMSQLTFDEAEALKSRLQAPRLYLRDRLAVLIRKEEADAAARARAAGVPEGVRLCGGKPPTDGDLAQIAEFARQLDQLGPAPSPDRATIDPTIAAAIDVLADAGLITPEEIP